MSGAAGAGAPLLLSVFSTFDVGGPQVRFTTLANRLGGAFRHAIVAMDGALHCAERLSPTLDVSYPELAVRKGETLGNAWAFRQALRRLRPDTLVTYNWGTIEWALANLWPVARHVHIEDGFGPEERAEQIRRRVLMRRAVLRRCTVVVPSRTLWDIATGVWRLPERRLRHVPNGIDLTRFAPVPRNLARRPVIGTVAALRPEKNLGRLLQAFRLLPDGAAELVIAGDGPARPGLEAMAAELGLGGRVRFAGHVADPSGLYADFDVFALSSDTEQMPLSVLEAMAAGLPVVATAVGDVPTLVASENRSFVAGQDAAVLAEGLHRLIQDGPLRARLGQANRAKAEDEFDERQMIRAYRALFSGAS